MPPDLVDVAADTSPDWDWLDTPEAEATLTWHGAGHLYTDYLRVAPNVRCWRTVTAGDDTMHATWEHSADPEDVIEFDGPQKGRVTMPTAEFLSAVRVFDRALLTAMEQRISELEQTGAAPGVELDLEQVRREHRERAGRLQRALDHDPGTDWDAVRVGVRTLLGTARPGRGPWQPMPRDLPA
ncbi:DUF5984 family protein [Streptomyces sp. NPDC051320]|uniref:DUF5984 family protein n=1 Tax=Streptomyces sp. NPDC051320 TaxID=3154644 RepID=UPI003431BCDB